MSSATNSNYIVYYTNGQNILSNVISISYTRNLHPSENEATIVLAGIQNIEAAREIQIFRQYSDGNNYLVWRGMTTNVSYNLDASGAITTISCQSLWHILEIRLLQNPGSGFAGQPLNTNPYIGLMNPYLNMTFDQLLYYILSLAFKAYSTGFLPPIIPLIPTDFSNVIVFDQMFVKYVSVAEAIDRLWSSALFNYSDNQPYNAEMFLIDNPNGVTNQFITDSPQLTVKQFGVVQVGSGYRFLNGIGKNKTGAQNPLFPNVFPYETTINVSVPASNPTPLQPRQMITASVDVYDSITFVEGENIVSINLTYDYESMANSFVFTGGNFPGAEVTAVPLDNPPSIAYYGLKQMNKSLNNVIDQDEIDRYAQGTLPMFARPLPNLQVVVDPVYGSQFLGNPRSIDPGDLISFYSPTIGTVVKDANGNTISNNFYARVKTVSVTWDAEQGEQISYTFMYPLELMPQFMYGIISPSDKIANGQFVRQMKNSTYQREVTPIDWTTTSYVVNVDSTKNFDNVNILPIPINAQLLPFETLQNTQQFLLYAFWITITSASGQVTNAQTFVIQPDGQIVYSQTMDLDSKYNVLQTVVPVWADPPSNSQISPLVPQLNGVWLLVLQNSGVASGTSSSNIQYNVTVQLAHVSDPTTGKVIYKAQNYPLPPSNVIVSSGVQQTQAGTL
jgi:hypothetical protein